MSWIKLISGTMSKGTTDAAGWDVFSDQDVTINPGESVKVMTNVITQMSIDLYVELHDKSGLSANERITKRAGIIDSDYPKPWCVVLVNEGKEPFIIKKGIKITQAIIKRKSEEDYGGKVKLLDKYNSENCTGQFTIKNVQRNDGFGSTGK